MHSTLSKIEKIISESINNEDKIGILNGLSGVVLFYDYLYLLYPREEFKDKLLTITDKINTILSEEYTSSTLCAGLAGFGLVLLRMKNNFIQINQEYFESIDSILLEELEIESSKSNYDFLHGSMGIALYFIERYKTNKSNQIIEILNKFSKDLIDKINLNFKAVLIMPVFESSHCYYLGMAHGAAGYLNFLIYLELHFKELKYDIKAPLNACIAVLKEYKNKSVNSKQYYPNLILLEENKVIDPIVAWCQGDLGISNALYNSGIYLKDVNLVNEAVELIANINNITLEESGIKDYAMCHGSMGVLIQYHLASIKSSLDYSTEISKWNHILKEQTKNFNEFLAYNSGTYSNEISLLDGLVGLGLGILTLEKQIDTSWLEIFNLH